MALKKMVQQSLASGSTYRELADKVGVSHATIYNIMAGRPPNKLSLSILQLFATYYHVALDDVLSMGNGHHRSPKELPLKQQIAELEHRLRVLRRMLRRK